jgi:hypothetical protein
MLHSTFQGVDEPALLIEMFLEAALLADKRVR